MGYYELSREARFEFRRLTARSLLESAERELDRHRAAGHRLRARLAEQRVRERRALLADAKGEDAALPRGGTLVAALTLTWLATVAALAAAIVQFGLHGVTGVADVAMVAATVAWFAAVVLRVPPPEPEPPQEEDAHPAGVLSLIEQYHGGSMRDVR
jgi:hypothetical protein